MTDKKSNIGLAATMFIFGTIGIFVHYISLDSGIIAFDRSIVGMLFLIIVKAAAKTKFSFSDVKRNFVALCLSGAFLGFNWILLFESYRYTTVAVSTVCYNCGPVIFALSAPVLFKEKASFVRIACACFAMIGVVCVSGVFEQSGISENDFLGIILGLGAAVLYAATIVLNKKISDISPMDKAIAQLFVSAIVMAIYCLFVTDIRSVDADLTTLLLLLVIGIVHTGFAYTLYFRSILNIKPQSIAVLTYVDPVVAVILSVVILREHMTIFTVIGATLVIVSSVLCGLYDNKQNKHT